jgi:voltage-gated potassium channel
LKQVFVLNSSYFKMKGGQTVQESNEKERYQTLEQLEDWLEEPVLILGFIWLALLVIELVWGLNRVLEIVVLLIWGIFLLEFLVRLTLAPRKLAFLRQNWLTVISLVLPALRLVRVARFVQLLRLSRTARSLRLVKVIGSLNRGMRALRSSMRRRGFGYVILLTLVILFVGSAGIYAFETGPQVNAGIGDFGDALWFTSMALTTLGSDYWPRTTEGRVLTFLLALYAFTVFGYVTAALATFFIGREVEDEAGERSGTRSVEALREEIDSLRIEIRELSNRLGAVGQDRENSG